MPKKAADKNPTTTAKKKTRKKKVENTPVVETVAEVIAAPVAETVTADAPVKKRGRKPAAKKAEPEQHEIVHVATLEPGELQELINTPVPTTSFPSSDAPIKKTRKPRAKKADKKDKTVFTTTLQIGDAEYDITDITAKAYKAFKSVHKRKVVTDFRVYVKPEEGAAYYTVNGEGAPDYKIDL
ncbi:MAG: hypothetical protein K2K14_04200 [Ruminococcus sp.]|nr:hypothetical protein [Ruminococcus sp.]